MSRFPLDLPLRTSFACRPQGCEHAAAFGSSRDDSTIFDNFREAYCGKWSNEEEYAEQLAEDCCMLEGAPEFLKSYFDYKAFARDLFIDDYYFDSGFVFRRL